MIYRIVPSRFPPSYIYVSYIYVQTFSNIFFVTNGIIFLAPSSSSLWRRRRRRCRICHLCTGGADRSGKVRGAHASGLPCCGLASARPVPREGSLLRRHGQHGQVTYCSAQGVRVMPCGKESTVSHNGVYNSSDVRTAPHEC